MGKLQILWTDMAPEQSEFHYGELVAAALSQYVSFEQCFYV